MCACSFLDSIVKMLLIVGLDHVRERRAFVSGLTLKPRSKARTRSLDPVRLDTIYYVLSTVVHIQT